MKLSGGYFRPRIVPSMSKFLENAGKATEKEAQRIETEGDGNPSPDQTPPAHGNENNPLDDQGSGGATNQGGAPDSDAAQQAAAAQQNSSADGGGEGGNDNGGGQPGAAPGTGGKSADELAEEKAALAFLKRRHPGIEADDLDSFYEKLEASNKPAAPAAPVNADEAKKLRTEKIKEKFLTGGGTQDVYDRLQSLTDIADEELVKPSFVATFKELHPDADDSEAEAAFAKAFFIGDEGVDFSAAEIAFGSARLKEVADGLRAVEGTPLTQIEGDLDREEEGAKWIADWTGKIDAFKQNGLPKEISVSLGTHREKDLGNFKYPLTAEQQQDVAATLLNPHVFSELFADPKTKQTDLNALSDFIIWKKYGPQMIQAAAQSSYSEGLDAIKSTLDNRPNLSGYNGSGVPHSKELQEGVDQLKKDAGNTLGQSAKANRKSMPS